MMTDLTSKALGIDKENVLVASTGVIGVPLPIGAIENGMNRLVGALGKDDEESASEAI
ncbi:MAG TPA: arginine biosynthesis protein ArgJ, partial [Clostridiaceae bacterium]|nr:arginine biosynthesis protein ArgJ [Clostridiaceae bacterium]